MFVIYLIRWRCQMIRLRVRNGGISLRRHLSEAKQSRNNSHKPKRVFFLSLIATLLIAVPVAYAVGSWVTINNANEVLLGPYGYRMTASAVSSTQLRMYQNQRQLDSGDPNLCLRYEYPPSGNPLYFQLYAQYCGIGWGDANPYVWDRDGGNKFDSCLNPSDRSAGRVVTCQRHTAS